MDWMYGIGCIVGLYVLSGIFWGIRCQDESERKGYKGEGFWYGFFFQRLALYDILSQSDREDKDYYQEFMDSPFINNGKSMKRVPEARAGKGWFCSFCDNFNYNYVGTCSCGKTKADSANNQKERIKPLSP